MYNVFKIFIILISLKFLYGFDIQPYITKQAPTDDYTNFKTEGSRELEPEDHAETRVADYRKANTKDYRDVVSNKPRRHKHNHRPVCLLEAEDFFYAERDVRLNFKGTDKCRYIIRANETLIEKPVQYQRGLHFNTIYFNITSSGVYIIELNLLAYHYQYNTFEVDIRKSHNKKGILARFELHTNMYQTVQSIITLLKGQIFFVNSETNGMNFEQSKMKIFKLHSL